MTTISKHLFEEACQSTECSAVVHPWHKSCIVGNLMCYGMGMIGSAKFYAIVYLVQILMRGKKMFKSKEEWRKIGENYIRSTLFGCAVCASANTLACFFRFGLELRPLEKEVNRFTAEPSSLRRLIQGGKLNYYTYILVPNTINGIGIFLEPPSRRGLVVNLFCNLLIEYGIRGLEKHGYLTMTKSKQTLMFMIGSALLFYLMRLEGDKESRTSLFWLFTPERVRWKNGESENPCPHKGSCVKNIAMGFSKLFGAGLAIALARIVLTNIRSPMKALTSINRSHFRMAMFFGSYIGIYRAVICLFCRRRGYDSPLYALPAGYLAGLSILCNPNLGISIASLTAAFKVYSTILYEKEILPANVPLPEILYCISQGVLFHARFMHPDICPKYVFNLMKSVSNGGTELLYKNMLETVKRLD